MINEVFVTENFGCLEIVFFFCFFFLSILFQSATMVMTSG